MCIIPTPKKVNPEFTQAEMIVIEPTIMFHPEFAGTMEVFAEYARRLYEIDFLIEEKGSIVIERVADFAKEEYEIIVNDGNVILRAGDTMGINHAFASLLQMMKVQGRSVSVPAVTIWDKPDRFYRGVMVDLGRAWHPFQYLIKYVDLCYFYKASFFHLHFSENESYTLPSDLYLELAVKGRSYTKAEIQYLTEYANKRGVNLMPEIDVPGHSACFARAYGELFGTKGVICQHEDSMQAMKDLFSELCDMFPYSEYIHIGGDEAYTMAEWTKCSKCLSYGRSMGIDVDMEDKEKLAEVFYGHFITEMANACKAKGRKPIVWEGFGKDATDYVPKDLIVMAWENYYHVTSDLLKAGYPVINCSWNPTYVVTKQTMWESKDIYDWSIGKWKAIHPDSPILETGYETDQLDAILGGQLHAWDDVIAKDPDTIPENIAKEYDHVAYRLPFIVENTWNVEKIAEYEQLQHIVNRMNAVYQK